MHARELVVRLARAAPLEGVTVPHIRHSTLVLAKVGSSMSVPQLLQNTTRCGAGTVQPAISRSLLPAISVRPREGRSDRGVNQRTRRFKYK